ncbi:MAG TPA: hypothetical protein PLF01_02160 [Alphaproteobacteria bacterium]|nr:hypothetical protein [Alphaproteobacteria bacterium]
MQITEPSTWYALREDFNGNVFIISERDTKEEAQADIDAILEQQIKLHHQSYYVSDKKPENALKV